MGVWSCGFRYVSGVGSFGSRVYGAGFAKLVLMVSVCVEFIGCKPKFRVLAEASCPEPWLPSLKSETLGIGCRPLAALMRFFFFSFLEVLLKLL